jgi:hypothetical protein
MDEIKAKQQVVEKIKEAGKILVTVSDSPSVDALSAALGLALLLDKQEKYATAIFSGETPPAIAFLEPEKTFDDTTDSLRDFIIALNKEKADHLRYKVEGDAVRIFITPYKTTITQDDLEFSQGDYNVELVIALGVDNQDHLDAALENHGQILHDATVITMTAGDQTSDLGGIDWHDANSSSLSEMVAGLAEAMKQDKKKSLLDDTISTALLTGIVAETDRFSNEHTTSKVMTVAASLMAAGADQQLIATELQRARTVETPSSDDDQDDSTDSGQPEGGSDDDATSNDADNGEGVMAIRKDVLEIDHESDETLAQLDKRVMGEEKAKEKVADEIEAIQEAAEEEAEKQERQVIEQATPKPEFADGLSFEETPPANAVATPAGEIHSTYAPDEEATEEPTFGGTLNATTEQAEDDARRAAENDQNKTILSHSYIGEAAAPNVAVGLDTNPIGFPGTPAEAPGSAGINDVDSDSVHPTYAFGDQSGGSTLSGLGGEKVIQPLVDTSTPVANASPASPALQPPVPQDFGLPLPPPLPDFSQGAVLPPAFPVSAVTQPELLGDILSSDQPGSGSQFFETSNAIPAPGTAYDFPTETPVAPAAAPVAANPGQFQIPTQP